MTARISVLAPIVALSMLSACSGVSVSVDFDPEEDFSVFRTFGWVPMPQPKTGDFRIDNPLLDTRIRAAIENELIGRGFELVIPYVGYTFFDSALGLDDGPVVGARLGYRFTEQLVLELEGGATFTETALGDKGIVVQAMGNLRYYFGPPQTGTWDPYATAGAGIFLFRGLGLPGVRQVRSQPGNRTRIVGIDGQGLPRESDGLLVGAA